MKRLLVAAIGLLLFAWPHLALAQIKSRWGSQNAMGWLTHNWGEMVVDPVFMGITILTLLVAIRFLYWSLLIVGCLVGPLALFISTNIGFGSQGYYLQGSTAWAGALFLGGALGLAGVFTLRAMGQRD